MGPFRRATVVTALGLASSPALAGTEDAAPETPTRWYGLSPSLSLGNDVVLNTEPENLNDHVTLGAGTAWSVGKLYWKGRYLEPLTASAEISVSGELAGTDESYRDAGFSEPALPDFEALSPSCYAAVREGQPVGNDCFARVVDGTGRRLDVSDLALAAAHGRLATIPVVAVAVTGSLKLTLPLSRASRTQDLILAFAPGVGLARELLGGRLRLSYGLSVSKSLRTSKTFSIERYDGADPSLNGQPVSPIEQETDGARLTSFAVTNSFGATYRLPWRLGASVSYSLSDRWSYPLDECRVAVSGSVDEVNVCENRFGDVNDGYVLKPRQLFMAGIEWQAIDWLAVDLHLTTDTPVREPDSGGIYNPFLHVNRNGYSSLGLTATVALDELYTALR